MAQPDSFAQGPTIAGTAEPYKNVHLDANKAIDVVRTASLRIGASGSEVAVTATPAEINAACDKLVQALTGAAAIAVDGTVNRATIAGGAYAFTLAAPGAAAVGQFLSIEYVGGDTDVCTLSLANVTGGSAATTASFNADGEGLLLFGAATKWVVVKEFGGVTLT